MGNRAAESKRTLACSTRTDVSSGLERRSLTARAARPCRLGLSRHDRYDVGARDGPASDSCSTDSNVPIVS